MNSPEDTTGTVLDYARPMRLADARRLALSLPETTEEAHFAATSFRVRGRIFATVPPDGKTLRIFLDADEARAVIAEDPAAYEPVIWGKRVVPGGVAVNLRNAKTAVVRELLEDAWRLRAPKRAIAALESTSRGSLR